jgi:hypothetical protein
MTDVIVEAATGEQLEALHDLARAAVEANNNWPELDDSMTAPEMSKLLRDAAHARTQALKALHTELPAELVLAIVAELQYARDRQTDEKAQA